MPELPEVENFRTLLLPLSSSHLPLCLERCSLEKQPPRKFLDDAEIVKLNEEKYCLSQVLRKGKLIAMVLKNNNNNNNDDNNVSKTKYLLVHMGMTGRISTPDHVPQLESLTVNDYPPPHTYLKFICGTNEASFSDPRKFGSIQLAESLDEFDTLAPDAWLEVPNESKIPLLIAKLSNQSMGIKALLLDQKRVVSGVGNWVADEVLYQTHLHPDQNYLTQEQASLVLETLYSILSTAISCLVEKKSDYPKEWLFHYRWNGKKTTKDAKGRTVTFVTSGGRTSAIVPSLQQKNHHPGLVRSKDISPLDTPHFKQTGNGKPKMERKRKRERESSELAISADLATSKHDIDSHSTTAVATTTAPEQSKVSKEKSTKKRSKKVRTEPIRKSSRLRSA